MNKQQKAEANLICKDILKLYKKIKELEKKENNLKDKKEILL